MNRLCTFLLLFICTMTTLSATHHYPLTDEPIDVVIPTTDKDLPTLERCIGGIKKFGKNIRRVIVVSKKRVTNNAEWFPEANYPFSLHDVAFAICQQDSTETEKFLNKKNSRGGWYLQQLLKLYAPFVIPEISSNVLVLDSDTIFLHPVTFLNEQNGALFNVGDEYNKEYFVHADKLTNGLVVKKHSNFSGITHHMLFQRPLLKDLITTVEEIHQEPFWQAFCHFVNKTKVSGASEYEIYFNFALSQTDQVAIRPLKWKNVTSFRSLHKAKKKGFHYVSSHSWQRRK